MDLSSFTPEQLAMTPAMMPPDSVTPNLVNPESNKTGFYAVAAVVLSLMFTSVSLRLYTKLSIWRKATADDWTVIVAVCLTSLYFGVCCWCIEREKFGTHMYDISVAHVKREQFVTAGFMANWVQAPVFAFVKTCFFLMYINIFAPFRWLRISCYSGIAITWIMYLTIAVVAIYNHVPHGNETWAEAAVGPRKKHTYDLSVPASGFSLALDLYIFVLPMLAVRSLHMDLARKVGVAVVFAAGGAACVASTLSIYYRVALNVHKKDFTYHVTPVLLLALVEMAIGVTAASMPSCAHFFKKSTPASSTGGSRGSAPRRNGLFGSSAFVSSLRSLRSRLLSTGKESGWRDESSEEFSKLSSASSKDTLRGAGRDIRLEGGLEKSTVKSSVYCEAPRTEAGEVRGIRMERKVEQQSS